MVDRQPFPIPQVIDPQFRRCVVIPIPDDPEHVRVVAGCLWELTNWFNWERDPDKRGRLVAAVYKDMLERINWGFPVHGGACVPIYEQEETMAVRVSETDLVGGNLADKIVVGEGLEIEVEHGIGYELLRLSAPPTPPPSPHKIGDFKFSAQFEDHDGWLLCDGRDFDTGVYPELEDLIGNSFAPIPSPTGLTLPDPRGRALIAIGEGDGLTDRPLGASMGVESVALVVSEMPSHTHEEKASNGATFLTANGATSSTVGILPVAVTRNAANPTAVETSSRGGGAAHQNMQPSLAIGNLFIYAGDPEV